ncbi:MAG: hypothetical protein N3G21_03010 [Candidatus Hydrogenedentes bacterium]|nr:hypothetical protein [Candidatus Hydrogenedentota bacterium]
MKIYLKRMGFVSIVFGTLVLLCGCPIDVNLDQLEYERGFNDGFMMDDYYWAGFFDSLDTVGYTPIYYQGDKIPYVESPPYEAGYYDGLWFAYNDGYFVEYDYAFTIGFSEGYDCAYQPSWSSFLSTDQHIEYLNGGFSDGYNDGFSEGRVFGAYDYINGIPYDWLGAMMDYRAGLDLQVDGVGTGTYGPVVLYEWGTDPKTLYKSEVRVKRGVRSIKNRPLMVRSGVNQKSSYSFEPPPVSYRELTPEAKQNYLVRPTTSPRYPSKPLTLNTTWLDRIYQYRSTMEDVE